MGSRVAIMAWQRDPQNPGKYIWVVANPGATVSRINPNLSPSNHGLSRRVYRGPSLVTSGSSSSANPQPPAEMSTSGGKEREVTPPTPRESPEPPEPPKSSKGKRAASPDLASLAFKEGSKVPSSRRNVGPRPVPVPCWVLRQQRLMILKLTGKGSGRHWELVQQKIDGEFRSIVSIDEVLPVVAQAWLSWIENYGQEKWGISDDTINTWRNLERSAGAVNIYKHKDLRVHKTNTDGNCGYHAIQIALMDLSVGEWMTIQEMRNRVGDFVTQEQFEIMQKACDDDERVYLSEKATLKSYQDAIRNGYKVEGEKGKNNVWIDDNAFEIIAEKIGVRLLIWNFTGDVKGMEGPEKRRAEFIAAGNY